MPIQLAAKPLETRWRSPAGVFVDRWDRRRVMILADLLLSLRTQDVGPRTQDRDA